MRRSVALLVFAMLAVMGVFAPAASAAPAGPKVVIIVGPTHGATASYRADANSAYAEAIKYTSNVVKVYSPNATWSKVKAAVKGASIVLYLGHGNGWPSPYTYDPEYKTKDGFGLNATAGNGDSNTKYYGEPYVATLDLAPNAVILLNHLCYASGNSEPGDKAPSQTTARKRVVELRGRVPEGRRPGRDRGGPRQRRAIHPGPVHDPRHDRGGLAELARLQRAREVLPVDPDRRRDRLHRHRWRLERLLPLPGRPTRPHHRRGHRRHVRRHRHGPDDPRRARQRPGRQRRRWPLPRRRPDARQRQRPAARDRTRRRSTAHGRLRQRHDLHRDRLGAGVRASTIRRWTAGCPWPISCHATAAVRRSGRSTRPAAASRPTATAASRWPTSRAGSPNRSTGGSGSEVPATPCSTRRPAAAASSTSPGTASTAPPRTPTAPTPTRSTRTTSGRTRR